MGKGEWQFFRAIGQNVGWFNIQGVSITATARLGFGSDPSTYWFAGSASSFQSFGTRSFGGNEFISVEPPIRPPTGPTDTGRTTGPTDTGPQNPTPPPCHGGGSGDIGGELITPVFIGPKGGIQLDGRGNAYPYFGLAGGTPGKGASITVNTQNVTPGLSVGASGGFIIGGAYSANIDWNTSSFRSLGRQLLNGTWSFGGTTPGVSGNVTVTLAPKALQQNLCR